MFEIGTIIQAIKGLLDIKNFFKKDHSEYNEPLLSTVNFRFFFGFSYPELWDRSDPINVDGNCFTLPVNKKIEYRVWGCYDLHPSGVEEFFPSIDREVSTLTDFYSNKNKKIKILYATYWGTYIYNFKETSGQQILGIRLIYSVDHLKYMSFLVKTGDRKFCMQCQAPKRVFEKYQSLFLKLGASLKIYYQPSNEEENTALKNKLTSYGLTFK